MKHVVGFTNAFGDTYSLSNGLERRTEQVDITHQCPGPGIVTIPELSAYTTPGGTCFWVKTLSIMHRDETFARR